MKKSLRDVSKRAAEGVENQKYETFMSITVSVMSFLADEATSLTRNSHLMKAPPPFRLWRILGNSP